MLKCALVRVDCVHLCMHCPRSSLFSAITVPPSFLLVCMTHTTFPCPQKGLACMRTYATAMHCAPEQLDCKAPPSSPCVQSASKLPMCRVCSSRRVCLLVGAKVLALSLPCL